MLPVFPHPLFLLLTKALGLRVRPYGWRPAVASDIKAVNHGKSLTMGQNAIFSKSEPRLGVINGRQEAGTKCRQFELAERRK